MVIHKLLILVLGLLFLYHVTFFFDLSALILHFIKYFIISRFPVPTADAKISNHYFCIFRFSKPHSIISFEYPFPIISNILYSSSIHPLSCKYFINSIFPLEQAPLNNSADNLNISYFLYF